MEVYPEEEEGHFVSPYSRNASMEAGQRDSRFSMFCRNSSMGMLMRGSMSFGRHTARRAQKAAVRVRGTFNKKVDKAFTKEVQLRLIPWTLFGIAVGVALGIGVYFANPSDDVIRIIVNTVLALMCGMFILRQTNTGAATLAKLALLFYCLTMGSATALGIMFSVVIKPGSFSGDAIRIEPEEGSPDLTGAIENAETGMLTSFLNIGYVIIPTNIIYAAQSANYLGCMAFATAFSVSLVSFGERSEKMIQLIELTDDVITKLMLHVIYCAPVGIASIIASTIWSANDILMLFKALAVYLAIIMGVLLIHSTITLPAYCLILARRNPLTVFKAASPAIALAFGTSSSVSTMPLLVQSAKKLGIREPVSRFMIPLGTNLSRDGSCVFLAVSAIFLAQVDWILDMQSTSTNVSSKVDWILDMQYTSTNVWSNTIAVVCVDAMLQRAEKKKEEKRLKAAEEEMGEDPQGPATVMMQLVDQDIELGDIAGSSHEQQDWNNGSAIDGVVDDVYNPILMPHRLKSISASHRLHLSPRPSVDASGVFPLPNFNLGHDSDQMACDPAEVPNTTTPSLLSMAFPTAHAFDELTRDTVGGIRHSLRNIGSFTKGYTQIPKHLHARKVNSQIQAPLLTSMNGEEGMTRQTLGNITKDTLRQLRLARGTGPLRRPSAPKTTDEDKH
eukprot:gene22018-29077_t